MSEKKKKPVKKKVADKKVTNEKPLKIHGSFDDAIKKIFGKK